jgi:hypothetical protein
MANAATCQRCSEREEDVMHCLRDCPDSRYVWANLQLLESPGFLSYQTPNTWLKHMATGPTSLKFTAAIWWIWRWRNNIVLGDKTWKASDRLRQINLMVKDMALLSTTDSCAVNNRIKIKWKAPPLGKFKLNVDGSCDQSGVIGSGGLIRDAAGNWVAGFSSNDGCGDALIAELFGIYNGLVLLINNSVLHVECETDSTEIINLLMDRQSHSFHAYASLLAKITNLLDHLPGLVFKHVLREGNVCADFLARLGRNSTLGVTTWVTPPDGLLSLLNFDVVDF